MRRVRLSDVCYEYFLLDELPVRTPFNIRTSIGKIYRDLPELGISIYALDDIPGDREYRRVVSQLLRERRIRKDDDFPAVAYRVSDLPDDDAIAICGLIDPFCYVSLISAMEHYRLTDRLSKSLHLSTPGRQEWKRQADKTVWSIREELSPFLNKFSGIVLKRHKIPNIVRNRQVTVHETKEMGQSIVFRNRTGRISTIGQTFGDMLVFPRLCGGMSHVLEVWDERARDFLDEIVDVIDKHSSKVLKVRAGYILEERMKIRNPIVEEWKEFAQRGGSRKLDPTNNFAPTYSETWMLSINLTS